MAVRDGSHSWRGTLGGLLWIGGWVAVLVLVHSPWRDLGGLVSERLRWLERLVLLSGIVVGAAAGAMARAIARISTADSYVKRLRWFLYPAAVTTAIVLIVLAALGRSDPIGVVFAGFAAYWAGLDLTLGAVPLMEGRIIDRPSGDERAVNGADASRPGPPFW